MTNKENKQEKDINEVIEDVEKLADKELNSIAGAIAEGYSFSCPPGQVMRGNECVPAGKN